MNSFFSQIQSYFDASYGGRYVETILSTIGERDPRLARGLTGQKGKYSYQTEFRFPGRDFVRIADLALIDLENELPRYLIEIKYDDHRSPKNAGQLEDYVEYCREKNECKFIYLTGFVA
jgi:hypothetical protein